MENPSINKADSAWANITNQFNQATEQLAQTEADAGHDSRLGSTVIASIDEATDAPAEETPTEEAEEVVAEEVPSEEIEEVVAEEVPTEGATAPDETTIIQESVVEANQPDQPGETKEISREITDYQVTVYEFIETTRQLEEVSEEERNSNHYRELVHRQAIFFDASIAFFKKEQDKEPTSPNEIFTNLATSYMDKSEALRRDSDEISKKNLLNGNAGYDDISSKKLIKILEGQADAFAFRSFIAAEIANSEYDDLKQNYINLASSKDPLDVEPQPVSRQQSTSEEQPTTEEAHDAIPA